MNKKTKQDLKYLRSVANRLPITYYEVNDITSGTGKELIEKGVAKLKDGSTIESDKQYKQTTPVLRQTNHYRRLKRLYEQRGIDCLIDYVKKVQEIEVDSVQQIDGINYNAARL